MWSVERWEVNEAKEAHPVNVDELLRGHAGKGQRKRPRVLRARLPLGRLFWPSVVEVGKVAGAGCT